MNDHRILEIRTYRIVAGQLDEFGRRVEHHCLRNRLWWSTGRRRLRLRLPHRHVCRGPSMGRREHTHHARALTPARLRRAAGCLLMLVTGCSAMPSPDKSAAPEPIDLVLPRHANVATPLASLRGTLEVADGCLFIRAEDGTRIGLAWPREAMWDPVRRAAIIEDGEAMAGTEVRLVGGLYDLTVEEIGQRFWLTEPRPECVGDAFWYVGGIGRNIGVGTAPEPDPPGAGIGTRP